MKKILADDPAGVVVIVHGAFEHAGRYDEIASLLRQQGFHVVYGDLPGQGKSTRRRGHIDRFDQYIEAVTAWLDEAAKFQLPVFLLGHSMGGLITIRTLQEKRPDVKGVILSSPGLGILDEPTKSVKLVSRVLDAVYPKYKVEAPILKEKVTRNKSVIASDEADSLMLETVSVRWYWEFVRSINHAFKKINDYPDVPTLVVQAGEDLMVDIKETKKWFNQLDISEKSYKEWANLYHEILNEPERDSVVRHIVDFMKQKVEQSAHEEE
ncbi:phospholipase [Thalassobacillus devorans]|uniref:Phospholipase n=1 Tax=Thalassobacillus devorans TaxID=279813 RepID=A0ABQ1NMS9_9BACI|nr:alpha/beta hydrolase [Thalassobacillus devorans]NIK29116.1 lysophospholipase [Thalassobacillus devorans]GGC81048.1 phospholipase [Thalassobacillus devorans]